MGMGLKGAMHTYAQFTDLVYGLLPAGDGNPWYESIIGDHGNASFCPFVDDHLGSATDFNAMLGFLHTQYFPRVALGPIYFKSSML
jgi:hypothetical protein